MSGSNIKVNIKWSTPDGFLIYATDPFGRPYPIRELAYVLFAFDEPSFFGTEIEIVERDFRECIFLSPLAAMHYFSSPGYNELVSIEWPVDWVNLQHAAQTIRHSLESAAFTLDGTQGSIGAPVWRLDLPEADTGKVDVDAKELPYLDAWVDQTVWQMITLNPDVHRAFMAITENHPALASVIEQNMDPSTAFMDEDEWKVAIGLKQDDVPFTFGLQLIDPYTTSEDEEGPEDGYEDEYGDEHGVDSSDENWRLQIVLQDKSESSLQIYLPEVFQESDTTIPESWLPYLERIDRKTKQCIHLVPWLADDAVGGTSGTGETVSASEAGAAEDGQSKLKSHLTSDEALQFLEEASIRIADAGIQVYVPSWWEEIRHAAVKMKANVKSTSAAGTGYSSSAGKKSLFGLAQTVNFDWRIAVGDVEMSEAEFLQLVAQKRKLVRFHGRFIRVDSEEFRAIAARIKKTKSGKGLTLRDVFELHLLGGAMTDLGARSGNKAIGSENAGEELDGMSVMMEVELDHTLARLMSSLTHTKEIPEVQVPASFRGELRPYQKVGVSWLTFLRTYGLGACLADDMGLGKTIQYIAYLLTARDSHEDAPSLLICPTSVIGNWQKEIARFAPSLRVHVHYGTSRGHNSEFVDRVKNVDVVLTSYTLAQMDEEDFTEVTFKSICLDEAQNIKNPHTKQAQSIRKFEARHRIAMTGTPIENRLSELWSIFDFLNPGYLGSLHRFQEKFVTPIERHQDVVKLEQVKRLVHPLLLRRVKQDPAIQLDLPEKVEGKVFVSLTPEQAALYENVVTDMLGKLDKLTGIERSGIILTTLLKLKQICNHPVNFLKTGDVSGSEERSHKLTRLLEMVSELRDEGDSCLIFTQFVEMGQLLKEALTNAQDEKVLFLHGSLSKTNRDKIINDFQNGEAGIFILSLKAGGVGLNLTAANHVFHFDRWWNPAVENQATDRAFRIGQTKQVEVHKFVTLGTLEERIDEMIEQKQALSNEIVGGGESWITQMSTGELRDLFVLRREWVDMDA